MQFAHVDYFQHFDGQETRHINVHVTDYTANQYILDHGQDLPDNKSLRKGMLLEITFWDESAEIIKQAGVQPGRIYLLRNVGLKSSGNNLKGAVNSQDRGQMFRFAKIIEPVPESDPRWKELKESVKELKSIFVGSMLIWPYYNHRRKRKAEQLPPDKPEAEFRAEREGWSRESPTI